MIIGELIRNLLFLWSELFSCVRRHITRSILLLIKKEAHERMEYRTDEQVIARARQIAPLSDEDLKPLLTLVNGVREYCDLMESLMPELGGEIDVTKMSRNMDGDA